MSDKIPSFSDFSISKKNLSGDRIDAEVRKIALAKEA